MRTYVYCWQISVRDGIDVEIRITAKSAPEARRQVDSFLGEVRPFLGRDGRQASARAPLRRLEAHGIEGAGASIRSVPAYAISPPSRSAIMPLWPAICPGFRSKTSASCWPRAR